MRYLNIGGGNFSQKGWDNLDFPFPAREKKQRRNLITIPHNLMRDRHLPIADGIYDGVYTEHCIEHLSEEVVLNLFKEVHRILRPSGTFRISCPDAQLLWRAYKYGDMSDVMFSKKGKKASKEQTLIDLIATGANLPDNPARMLFVYQQMENAFQTLTNMLESTGWDDQYHAPGRHLSWWTEVKLRRALSKDFDNPIRMIRHRSSDPELAKEYLDNTQPKYSLIVECQKGMT
jgi:predicted SAM-dependent methyltransferase